MAPPAPVGPHAPALSLAYLESWSASLVILLLVVGAGLGVHALLSRLARRAFTARDEFWRSLIVRTRGPTRLAVVILALATSEQVAPLAPAPAHLIGHVLSISFIVLVGWIALSALDIAADIYVRRAQAKLADNLLVRKHVTQVRILERACATLIVLLTASLALMTISNVRQYGVSLLASAGAASVIVGLALQPLLSNLFAGIQIAMTQPIRINDAVLVENEWGWIDEITSTYVVVRTWDWRRLVLPLTYFIQKPFQNWTRDSTTLIGTAMFYVDYAAPIEIMRRKLSEIAAASTLWDGNVVNLAVTDLSEQTMQVRCLVSAKNADQTFDLRCEVREKMIAFLKEEHPEALPKHRLETPAEAAALQGDSGMRERLAAADRPLRPQPAQSPS
jgi:small-conductance mechanosensitive channel